MTSLFKFMNAAERRVDLSYLNERREPVHMERDK